MQLARDLWMFIMMIVCWPAQFILQDFRGFSRTGKARVLVMSYPCFRGHKAEVYKLGIDVLICDEVRQNRRVVTSAQALYRVPLS